MSDVELARRPDVELVRTGRFQTLTGSWNPTPADIKAAVDAMDCPAIRKPVIRIGHTDKRFQVSGDGEPALGWFENLRAADGGHTLVADQVTLPWLHSVQAAAYPSRSIEGNYNHRCSEGHVHPFVIHTVALLGVTPPGVQTLRSLNDLPEMLGVAATGEVPEGARQVQVTVMAAAEVHTGAMVALIPTVEDAARLALDGGEPAEELHVTLAYLGEAADLGDAGQQDVIDAVSSAANGLPQVVADAFSVNIFNPPGVASDDGKDRDTCLVLGMSGDLIDAVHSLISEALWSVPMPAQHLPWHAHMTIAYTDDLARISEVATRVGPIRFDRLRLAFGGQHVDIPLIGQPDEVDGDVPAAVAAAAGSDDELKDYWLHGQGLKRWADAAHPWTTLYRLIKKHVGNADKARRIASDWYREHFGHMPNQKVKAAGGEPHQDAADVTAPPESTTPAEPPALILPAAEPEPVNTEPKEGDPVSTTDLSVFRSRLGLDDTADESAITAAIDELKSKAETPAQPTPEAVAASAAAEEEASELRTMVTKLTEQMTAISTELAAAKQEKADTVKASVLAEAKRLGKFTPADEPQWQADYDEAPGVTTRILASIAPGTAVPVMASGMTGSPEPETTGDDSLGVSEESLSAWAKSLGIDEKELSRG